VRRSVGYGVTKVVVVCGPPGSGKSTYVAEHRKPHDIAVDLDALMAAISGRDWYDESPAHLTFAMAARDGIFNRLEQASGVPTAWIVMSGARLDDREEPRQRFGARVILLDVGELECLRRIKADPRRSAKFTMWKQIVKRWFREYERPESDERRIEVTGWGSKVASGEVRGPRALDLFCADG